MVITVLDEQPTSKLKHFLKSEFSRSFFYVVFPLEKFSLLGEVNTISDHEWLKIQTYVIGAHDNLSSDSSLACHIYCDSWHSVISNRFSSVWQWNCPCVKDFGLRRSGFEHPTFWLQVERLNQQHYCRSVTLSSIKMLISYPNFGWEISLFFSGGQHTLSGHTWFMKWMFLCSNEGWFAQA